MKRIITIMLYILTFALSSCESKGKGGSPENNKLYERKRYASLNIEKPTKGITKLDHLIKNITSVELEGHDSCYIASIDKIEEYENEYYILDKKQSLLFVFNKEGKYQRKIGTRGLGPKSYQNISSFGVDRNRKTVMIYSHDNISLFEYTLDGIFSNSMRLNFFALQMILLNDSTRAFYVGFENPACKYLILTDLKGLTKSEHFPYTSKELEVGFGDIGGISKSTEGILFNEVGSSYLYRINDTSIDTAYHIYLGKLTWPEDKKGEFRQFTNRYLKNDLAYIFNTFIENSQALIFEYLIAKKHSKAIYIRLKNSLYTENNIEDNALYCLFSLSSIPIGLNDEGKFISSLSSDNAFNFREKHYELYKKLEKTHPEIYQSIEKINEDSNPLLLIYDFK